jgi:uncharacterized membrane protein
MQNMSGGKSAIGLDANIAALIGYPIGILALVLIFIEKENKFVRFHALQSVIWSVAICVTIFVVAIVGTILSLVLSAVSGTLATLVGIVFMLVYLGLLLALLGGIIYGAIKAYGGEMTKLPFVGNLADKWA